MRSAIAIGLDGFACDILSYEGYQVRAMTEVDKPNCNFISDVEAWGNWFANDLYTIDALVDDVFNDALLFTQTVVFFAFDGFLICVAYYRTKFISDNNAFTCNFSERTFFSDVPGVKFHD